MSTRKNARASRRSSRSSTRPSRPRLGSSQAVPTTLRIESLAHGGAGVARLADGPTSEPRARVVFVPQTAPGDLVEAAVQVRGNRAEGRLLRVLEPGLSRVATRCVHVDVCGGCQWQQVGIEAQRQAKVANLTESLVRIAKIPRGELPVVGMVASPAEFYYRRRARFIVDGEGRLGYAGRDGQPAFVLRECHLIDPLLEGLALHLSALFRKVAIRANHIEVCAVGEQAAVLIDFDGPAGAKLSSIGELVQVSLPAVAGVVVRDATGTAEVGTVALKDGVTYLRPDAFGQANARINERLGQAVLRALKPKAGQAVLELFAGSGNFTLPLSQTGAAVTAVEMAGVSLSLLERALKEARRTNVAVVAGEAANVVRRMVKEKKGFELALLDPPRAGAKDVLVDLVKLGPQRIAYVSCDPATLARDVKELVANGYRLEAATVFDQFPQTYHLEALVVLVAPAALPADSC